MNPAYSPRQAALGGLRILDLTTVVFGPYASQILADYGADVVKIEAPGGDSTRRTGPSREAGLAAIFLGINRNKRSVVLDLKQQAARAALLTLVDGADVLMHSMRPSKMAKLGLDPASLCARNPRLVYAGLYGFGSGGAYEGQPAYDDVIQGLSGVADLMRRQTGTPQYLPTIAADKTCGLVAAHAILAALFQRERTGRGQALEVPMYESMTSFLMVEHLYGGHLGGPPSEAPGGMGYPRVLARWRRPYATADGHVCMMPYTDVHWQRFFAHSGRADLAADTRFKDIAARTRHIEILYALTGEIVARRDTAHWLALCRELEIPAAPVNRLEDLPDDPHLRSVGLFVDIDDGHGQAYRYTRNPVRMADSDVAPAMAPRLGEHTREVLREAGLSEAAIAELAAQA
ncbi:CaiB/BaiF CoA transferase family protein [Achromobacter aloeverae]|uniref:CoA transferase n=1 Tax=Achromobacter aloeverae TaxID=1750518 RepID=A0A4Q1HEG0_9BURK|nr:CoA transferase [Achromobacter aloeverae]RXN83842.1 CoA transferase [Achromobacter aloeverae]